MNTGSDTKNDAIIHQNIARRQRGATTDHTRSIGRTIIILTAAIGMLVGLLAAAPADGAGFELEEHQEGLFYGNFDQEILLFAGATAAEFCTGEEPVFDARVFTRRNGTVETMVDAEKVPIYLYSSTLGAPDLVTSTCEALAANEAPLAPFAEGAGQLRMRIEEEPDGTLHVVNSTVGTASSAGGTTWRVRGWADLTIGATGPIGNPAEFQGLRVTQTGR